MNYRTISACSILFLSLAGFACGSKDQTPETSGTKGDSVKSAAEGSTSSGTSAGSESAGTSNTTGTAPAGGAPAAPSFGVKSGIVTNTNSVGAGNTETLYFDDFGARQAVYRTLTASVGGKPAATQTVVIIRDGMVYSFNPENKKGVKMNMPPGMKGLLPDFASMAPDARARFKYHEIEPRTFLGKVSQGFSVEQNGMPVKIWTWKGVPMHMESGGAHPIVIETTKLETDVAIPAEKFVVPTDIKLTAGGSPSSAPSGSGMVQKALPPGVNPTPIPGEALSPSGE